MNYTDKAIESRKAEHEINPLFLKRWSPRALGKDVSKEQLMQLFEAARWAPSSNNLQPWRFIYAKNGSKYWDKFYNLLVDFNQIWCANAAYLVIIISNNTNPKNNELNKTHSFDSGSAWMSLALQAADMGLITHGMGGFDYNKTKEMLGLTEHYNVEAMFAVASPAELEVIPERMQKGEVPSTRKKVEEFAFEGSLDD